MDIFFTMAKLCDMIWMILFSTITCVSLVHTCPQGCSCPDVKNKEDIVLGSRVVCRSTVHIERVRDVTKDELPQDVIYLDLSGNRITELREGDFDNLPQLQKLNLSGNGLVHVEAGALSTLTKLQRLDLSHNAMTSINSSMFRSLGQLERLYLEDNKISIIDEGTFDGLIHLKRINFASDWLTCDCKLSWLVDWCKNQNVRVAEATTCQHPVNMRDTPFKSLVSQDLHCDWIIELGEEFSLVPNRSQLVFSGDKLQLRCLLTSHKYSDMKLTWMREGQEVIPDKSAGKIVHSRTLPNGSLETRLLIEPLSAGDNGIWQCAVRTRAGTIAPLAVNVIVMSNSTVYCPETISRTNKGTYTWTKTPSGTVQSLECEYSTTSGHMTDHVPDHMASASALAIHKCNSDGAWEGLDVSQCQYTSVVTRSLQRYAQMDFRNVSVTELLAADPEIQTLISDPDRIRDPDDVIFMSQIIEHFLEQDTPNSQLGGLVVESISMMMDVRPAILYAAQTRTRALSRMVASLDTLAPRMVNAQPVFSRNIAMHVMRVNTRNFHGVVCNAYTSQQPEQIETKESEKKTEIDGDLAEEGSAQAAKMVDYVPEEKAAVETYDRDNFVCEQLTDNAAQVPSTTPSSMTPLTLSASITLPPSLLSRAHCDSTGNTNTPCEPMKSDIDTDSILFVTVFRNANLFPVRNDGRMKREKRRDYRPGVVRTPVIAAKIAGTTISNTSEPIVIKLKPDWLGHDHSSVYWNFQANDEFGGWLPYGCHVIGVEDATVTAHCTHLTHFAILQSAFSRTDGQVHSLHWLLGAFSMSPFVYAGSFILTVCAMTTLITYMLCSRSVEMPGKLKHCVANTCLGILMLCLLFTFGMHTTAPARLCHVIGMALHYCSVCVLLWIAVTAYIMYKKYDKLAKPPEPRDPDAPMASKPVLGLYLIGWGLGLILCGIVAAINSLQHYHNEDYCFLTPSAQVLALYLPVFLLLLVCLALFLCVCCSLNSPGVTALQNNDLDLAADPDLLVTTDVDVIGAESSVMATTVATNHSALVNVSLNRSQPDLHYKPANQLLGLVALLFLYMVTWACAALSVALPFQIYHQDILFNCLYLFASSALGVFMVVFFVFGRPDGRTSWHNACCCVKSDDLYDFAVPAHHDHNGYMNGTRLTSHHRGLNGHITHSASSLEGSNCTSNHTRRSHNNYLYGPIKQSNLSSVHSNPPAFTDSSLTVAQEYPNFINPKQNGIARKYWRKQRQRNTIYQRNKELYQRKFDNDSDLTDSTTNNKEIRLQPLPYLKENGHNGVSQSTMDNAPANGLRPPLTLSERYRYAPIVGGLSSPPLSTMLPPDGGSCVTEERAVLHPGYDDYPPLPPPPRIVDQRHYTSHSLPRPNAINNSKLVANPLVNAYMQRNGSVPRIRDFDGKSSTSRDTRDTRALSIGSDSQVAPYGRQDNSSNNKDKAFKRQASEPAARSSGRSVLIPVPPKRQNNIISMHVRDKSISPEMNVLPGATELTTFGNIRALHPSNYSPHAPMHTSQFQYPKNGSISPVARVPVSVAMVTSPLLEKPYLSRASVERQHDSLANTPLLANVNLNSNNSTLGQELSISTEPFYLDFLNTSDKSPIQLSPRHLKPYSACNTATSANTCKTETDLPESANKPDHCKPLESHENILTTSSQSEQSADSKNVLLPTTATDANVVTQSIAKEAVSKMSSKQPAYVYVNHSYTERVMQDLIHSPECQALLAEDRIPDWLPRSVSGYERISGHVSDPGSIDWSDEAESGLDPDDVWLPRKRRRRKASNKETCV